MKILVVEDDRTVAEPLATGLRRQGFDVTLVATGRDALAAADHDVVLLDLGLPDMDGTEVCRQIRSGSDVPIIVVTARGDEVDRVIVWSRAPTTTSSSRSGSASSSHVSMRSRADASPARSTSPYASTVWSWMPARAGCGSTAASWI